MTSKRDLRAMVERLTAQLNMAKDERDRTARILEQMYDLLDKSSDRLIEMQDEITSLRSALNQARGVTTVNNMTTGRFPDVRSLSMPDEAA